MIEWLRKGEVVGRLPSSIEKITQQDCAHHNF